MKRKNPVCSRVFRFYSKKCFLAGSDFLFAQNPIKNSGPFILNDNRADCKRFILTTQPFTMTPNSVIFDTTLPALVRLCYSALEDFSGEHKTCWPGYAAIAKKVGCSARWVPELLKRLVKAGLLVIQYREGRSNIYTLQGRVVRQQPTQEARPGVPRNATNYEPKQPNKANKEDRAYRRFNAGKKPGEAGAMEYFRRLGLQ